MAEHPPFRRVSRARAALSLAAAVLCLAGAARAQQRPLVAVFADAYGPASAGKNAAGEAAPAAKGAADGTGPAKKPSEPEIEPSVVAMWAVRDLLNETTVVNAVAFQPDAPAPIFVRAAHESKLALSTASPTAEERLKLAKGVGASFAVTIRSEPAPAGGVIVEAKAREISSGKEWSAREQTEIVRVKTAFSRPSGKPYSDEVLSAANTVVQRFRAGPLSAYLPGLPALAPPSPTAPSPAANIDLTVRRDVNAESQSAIRRGEELLAAGDTDGAIVALRQAVNLAPRSAPARVALTQAYLKARRGLDAIAEARRALAVVPASDAAGQTQLTRLLAQGFALAGDTTAARTAYEQIIAAQPRAFWARVALGDLLLTQGRTDEAEAQYLAVRRADSDNREATERLARLKAARGDYTGALEELSKVSADPALQTSVARDLFDAGVNGVAAALTRDRKAFEEGQLSREVFYKAAAAHAERAGNLLSLIRGAAPAGGGSAPAHRRRVLAASLLSQAAGSLLSYLETGEAAAGMKATVLLNEATREIAQARSVQQGED